MNDEQWKAHKKREEYEAKQTKRNDYLLAVGELQGRTVLVLRLLEVECLRALRNKD